MTVLAWLKDLTLPAPLRSGAFSSAEVYTSAEIDALLASDTYEPVITEAPNTWVATADEDFLYTRIGRVVTITGTIHLEDTNPVGAPFTDGFDFSLPAGLLAVQGSGNGAGFVEDGTKAALFTLNDDGDGFTIEHFEIPADFTTDIRFTFTFLVPVP